MTTAPDAWILAHDIIEVHGIEAAAVARKNAHVAALAGQPDRARSWIRVLGVIQCYSVHSDPDSQLFAVPIGPAHQ